jgi:hypothetical protein
MSGLTPSRQGFPACAFLLLNQLIEKSMAVLTLFCCGTGSNSFDASRSAREKDQWDDDSPEFPGNTKFDILVRDAHPRISACKT